MTSRYEVLPTPDGVMVNYHGIGTQIASKLSIADAYELQTELDTQIALASGLDLINVRAEQVQVEDVLWHIGKVTVDGSEDADDQDIYLDYSHWRVTTSDGSEFHFHPMTRLWVGRPII